MRSSEWMALQRLSNDMCSCPLSEKRAWTDRPAQGHSRGCYCLTCLGHWGQGPGPGPYHMTLRSLTEAQDANTTGASGRRHADALHTLHWSAQPTGRQSKTALRLVSCSPDI